MSTDTGTSLKLSRVVKADPATVFRAWTEPSQMKQWACPETTSIVDVTADLKVGGNYMIKMKNVDGTIYTAVGKYRAIERPNRLVYTWDWEEKDHAIGQTIVTVEFIAVGDATEVVLTHELFPSADAKTNHEQGWASCLNRLDQLLG